MPHAAARGIARGQGAARSARRASARASSAQANETLRKSERRFRALIEHGSDSIALIDTDSRILYLSPAVTNVEGYQPEELLGQPRHRAHAPGRPAGRSRPPSRNCCASPGKPIPAIWRRRHKDGHWIWLEGVATNLLDDPSVGAIVTNYRDITERLAHESRLGEQLQRLALMSRITRAIGERQDLRSIFQVVVRSIEEELPVDFCMHLPVRRGREPAHRELRRRAQRTGGARGST